ncbi:hypothetical protein Tco_1010362 [Tanacetum coccineum]
MENFTLNVLSLTTLVAELKTLQWELLVGFISIPTQVESVQAKIKTLDALPSLLKKVTEALNKFAQVMKYASKRTKDTSAPSTGQASTNPANEEININQVIISYPPKGSTQPEREHIKKYKGKKAMSSKDAGEESSGSDSDDIIHLTGSMVESSKKKKLKKFDFFTKDGDHVHLTEEQIKEQKKIEKSAKVKAAKQEVEVRKEELVDLFGPDVVSKYYKAMLQYDKYCDKMLNRRASSKITNCDVLTRKVPITLKVYREDGTSEVIPNFKANDLYLDFVTIEDFKDFSNEMLYTIQEIFFKLHQGLGLDDHARTFSSFLLAEVDKRNLNPLKQITPIKQLRQ